MPRPIRVALIMILALFDLDGFKSYNEQLRPRRRDALLQRLASALRAASPFRPASTGWGATSSARCCPAATRGVLLRAASAVLSEGERALMRQHTVAGERIIAPSPALADVARWCALRSSAGTAPAIPTSSAASRFRGPRGSSRSATPITR